MTARQTPLPSPIPGDAANACVRFVPAELKGNGSQRARPAPSPLVAGESHMGIWAVLQPATISILKISPCWGGIDAGLYFDFRGLGGPARGERAARSAGASVHRAGGSSVRSGRSEERRVGKEWRSGWARYV